MVPASPARRNARVDARAARQQSGRREEICMSADRAGARTEGGGGRGGAEGSHDKETPESRNDGEVVGAGAVAEGGERDHHPLIRRVDRAPVERQERRDRRRDAIVRFADGGVGAVGRRRVFDISFAREVERAARGSACGHHGRA